MSDQDVLYKNIHKFLLNILSEITWEELILNTTFISKVLYCIILIVFIDLKLGQTPMLKFYFCQEPMWPHLVVRIPTRKLVFEILQTPHILVAASTVK